MERIWKPNVTVAAVIEQDGRYLLVEEETDDGLRFNQPAGHLEPNESLIDATAREALEESAYVFTPQALVGIYQWTRPQGDITYLRFAFCGALGDFDPARPLDDGILRTVWMTPAALEATRERHRIPLIWLCAQDHQAGRRYPLDLIRHYAIGT